MKNVYKVIIFLIILFVLITGFVMTNNTIMFDNSIYSFFRSFSNDFIDNFFIFITKAGNTLSIIVLLIIFNIILTRKNALIFDSLAVCSVVSNTIIKYLCRRNRPTVLKLIKQGGYSFPSGHTMISITMYGFLIFLIYKNIKNKYLKIFLIFLLSCLIFLVSISRIYVGVHYASDVLAGFILGLAELLLIVNFSYGGKAKCLKF